MARFYPLPEPTNDNIDEVVRALVYRWRELEKGASLPFTGEQLSRIRNEVSAAERQLARRVDSIPVEVSPATVPNALESLTTMSSGGETPNWVEEGGALRLETTEFNFDVDLTAGVDDLSGLSAILFNLDYSILAMQTGEGAADTRLDLSSDIELRVAAQLRYEGEVLSDITPATGLVASAGQLVGSGEEETYQALVYPVGAKLFSLPEVSNSSPELSIRFGCTITSGAPIDIPLNSEQAGNEFVFVFTKGENMWYIGLRR